MSEKSDRRGRRQRLFSVRIISALLFFLAPCAFFLFTSPDLELPRIRIEYGPRRCRDGVPSGVPAIESGPLPPPPAMAIDGDHERRRVAVDGDQEQEQRLPPPRQLTDAPYSLGPSVSDYDARRAKWLRDHPGFPAFVAPGRRPRVLMVTGSSPHRCGGSDGGGDHLLLRAFKNKADYCRVHGLDIFYSTAVLDVELSGFWTKLPLLRALMLAHPETEFFWWLDSDAVLTDMLFEPPWDKYARHNLVLPGWDEKVYTAKSWLGINAGSFIIRNCQWSLDLLDAWSRMGPRGPVRYKYGKLLAAALSDREPYEADDQSALVYLLVTYRERWGKKTFLEASYNLHSFWVDIVDRYEEMQRNGKPGLGDDRWPLVTHFVGCKPCGGQYASYDAERCRRGMERALNFADDQILGMYGFQYESLNATAVRRVRNQTGGPLDVDDVELARLLHPTFKAAKWPKTE